jgi:antitoxin (DNA-binding transcriptional repressor) of toxin-antitoxin stability system
MCSTSCNVISQPLPACNYGVDVSISQGKNRLTRHGKPVAQISPLSAERRQIQWGAMRDRIRLLPGWDAPIDLNKFLVGDL